MSRHEGQQSLDMTMPLLPSHENIVYRCTRCKGSNIPIDSVSPTVDARWVFIRCLDCQYNIGTKHVIPSHMREEEPE